jgi:hypothetical protein
MFVALTLLLVSVPARAATMAAGGKSSETLDTAFLGALVSAGIAPSPLKPATLDGLTLTFPITGGVIDVESARGEIYRSGGVRLTKGETQVDVLNPVLDTTGPAPVVTGIIVVNGVVQGRVPFADAKLPELALPLQASPSGRVSISNIEATVSETGAAALNGVFGTTAFVAGLPIVSVTLSMKLRASKVPAV